MLEMQLDGVPVLLPATVRELTGLSRSALYGQIRAGKFPPPIALNDHEVCWIEAQVQAWLQSRDDARRRLEGFMAELAPAELPPEDGISPGRAAHLIGVKVSTLAWWRSAGRHADALPYTKVWGRVYYRRSDVERFLQSDPRLARRARQSSSSNSSKRAGSTMRLVRL